MNKPLSIAIIVAILILGYAVYLQYPFTETRNIFKDTNTTILTVEDARAMLLGAPIEVPEMNTAAQLVDGKAEFTIPGVPTQGSIWLGDVVAVNQVPGGHDILATFVVNGGGTGNFTYVILFNERDGGWKQGGTVFLGDRIIVETIQLAGDVQTSNEYRAIIHILDRKSDEAMAAVPTMPREINILVNRDLLTDSTDIENIDNSMITCTMDAKICPDGSGVGRVPPACEFAPCP